MARNIEAECVCLQLVNVDVHGRQVRQAPRVGGCILQAVHPRHAAAQGEHGGRAQTTACGAWSAAAADLDRNRNARFAVLLAGSGEGTGDVDQLVVVSYNGQQLDGFKSQSKTFKIWLLNCCCCCWWAVDAADAWWWWWCCCC